MPDNRWSKEWPTKTGWYFCYISDLVDSFPKLRMARVYTETGSGYTHHWLVSSAGYTRMDNEEYPNSFWLPIETPQLMPGRDYDAV